MSGKTFGQLTALEYLGSDRWKCICTCGNETITRGTCLRSGNTKSCGCLKRKNSKDAHTKHGHLTYGGEISHLYATWTRIRSKCRSKSNKSYKSFGAKGIDICDDWYDDYQAFYDWAQASGYSDHKEDGKYTLVRINKQKGFSPSNCTWAECGTVDLPLSPTELKRRERQAKGNSWVDLPNEIWRPIAGHEGQYEVSNCGRVRSIVFRNGVTVIKRKKLISQIDHGNGYLYVSLRNGKHRKNYYVHRLVAEAFIPNPDNLPIVDHIDFDKKNNVVSNLQWLTQKQNVERSIPRMSKPRLKPMTNTGERYISKMRATGDYKVIVFGKTVGSFKSLEEAVIARDAALQEFENAR